MEPQITSLSQAVLASQYDMNGENDSDARSVTTLDSTSEQPQGIESPVGIQPIQGSLRRNSKRGSLFEGIAEDDQTVIDQRSYERLIVDHISDLEECKRTLIRTRAVTLMSDKIKLAQEERECYEEVSKLIVALFGIERTSIALMDDFEHVRIMQMAVNHNKYSRAMDFSMNDSGMTLPLQGTSFGHLVQILQPIYVPDVRVSPFMDHQKIAGLGLRTVINAPLLIAGRKFIGSLNVGAGVVDAFSVNDQLLIKDIASTLASAVFTLRMQKSQKEDAATNERLLQAMIPDKVLARIDHYWRDQDSLDEEGSERSVQSTEVTRPERLQQVRKQLERFQTLRTSSGPTRAPSADDENQNIQVLRLPSRDDEIEGVGRALYAEEKKNVSIIFSDIVGFSRISDGLKPIRVMDMLHDLFHRYDTLCEKHGVYKVETIGDGCVMAAGLLEDSSEHDEGRAAARRALAIAQDMVREARQVPAPRRRRADPVEYLEIRVGIHVGPTTCGVLGKVMPRFQVFGSAVNMAARMEQTSKAGMVHVSKAFHDLLGEEEDGWQEPRTVSVKNMGEQQTWLLDPDREAKRLAEAGTEHVAHKPLA